MQNYAETVWQTSCTECHAGTPQRYETQALAEVAWNARTPQPAADEIASLELQVKTYRDTNHVLRETLRVVRESVIEALRSPQMQAVGQTAIRNHPHYDGGPVSAYGFSGAVLRDVAAALSQAPVTDGAVRREEIAEIIWRAEYRRATEKERSVSWADGVEESDKDSYRFIASAILAGGAA